MYRKGYNKNTKGVENYDVKILENYLTNLNLNNLLNVRTSLILKILLYSGARRGEILALKIEDFKEDDELYIINTIGKGDKERILCYRAIYQVLKLFSSLYQSARHRLI